jgi:CBS domain-containing protein
VLTLQRVVEPIYDAVGGGDVTTFVIDEDATTRAEEEAKAYLERAAANLSSRGYHVVTRLHRGRPAAEILDSMGESNPDLIVMTTHGRTGPARWIMGSVADEVSRSANRPVFLVSVRAVVSQVTGGFTVRDLMTRDPETLNENESVISAARKMLRRRVSGAPVVDDAGSLVGVLSEYDLLAWHDGTLKELARNDADLDPSRYGRLIETETIASLLTRPAISVDQDADMVSALRLMLNRKLRRLPVTDGGQLVGIISRADIVRAMAQHWSTMHEANEQPFEVISL